VLLSLVLVMMVNSVNLLRQRARDLNCSCYAALLSLQFIWRCNVVLIIIIWGGREGEGIPSGSSYELAMFLAIELFYCCFVLSRLV
jgi:hypothetical protein